MSRSSGPSCALILLLLVLAALPACERAGPRAPSAAEPLLPLRSPPTAPAAADAADAADVADAAERHRLRLENEQLRLELAAEREKRQERERGWLAYVKGLAELAPRAGVELPSFETEAGTLELPAPAAKPPSDPALEARALRDAQILRRMQALLIADSVQGLDVLELGTFQDGFTGPVVFRTLDDEGRPFGSICADRLQLEGSRAARTLTFVFSVGYQRRGEQRTPFAAPGVLRVELPEVDPTPWLEGIPELFANAKPRDWRDDRLYDLTRLRVALNLQLREDAASGYWRLSSLEGVVGGVLREVVLDGFGAEGQLERKLFADSLRILERPQGVVLLLESGAQIRGEVKTPFLEGRYRIILPRASSERMRAEGIPVLAADE